MEHQTKESDLITSLIIYSICGTIIVAGVVFVVCGLRPATGPARRSLTDKEDGVAGAVLMSSLETSNSPFELDVAESRKSHENESQS